jgi:histidinol-phosphatase (PHP family)
MLSKIIDSHMHSSYSPDADHTLEAMSRAAIRAGLRGIIFTEHLELDQGEPHEPMLRIGPYIVDVRRIQASFAGKLHIGLGIEAGFTMNTLETMESILTPLPLDFVIGSVHVVGGQDLFYGAYFERQSQWEAYRGYLNAILETAKGTSCYSVLGHIGFISKIAPYTHPELRYEDHPDLIDEIFKTVIDKGKGIELNTSGIRTLGWCLPQLSFVKRYRALGGEIITIGSDAHRVDHVAHGIEPGIELLKAAGFKYVAHYEKKRPVFTRL